MSRRESVQLPSAQPGQFQYALVDIQFQHYANAQQRLEFIIKKDPTFPGAQQKLTEVKINIEALKEGDEPLDVEMLQDLVLAAVNEALDKSQKLAADRMGAISAIQACIEPVEAGRNAFTCRPSRASRLRFCVNPRLR